MVLRKLQKRWSRESFKNDVLRNVFFWYLAHILFGNCYFYNDSSVTQFTRIWWRKASKTIVSDPLRFGYLTTRREMYSCHIWYIYYSGIVNFTPTRSQVNFHESGDARLQKRRCPPKWPSFLKPDVGRQPWESDWFQWIFRIKNSWKSSKIVIINSNRFRTSIVLLEYWWKPPPIPIRLF